MTEYSILLPRTDKDSHTHAFDEVADAMVDAMAALGFETPLIHHVDQVGTRTAIVLAPHLLHLQDSKLPENLILYNFEQIYEGCRWFNDRYRYHELLAKYPVWDYSTQNIEMLKKLGINKQVVHCPFGYMPSMERFTPHPEEQKDIDVLFVGGSSPRRDKIIQNMVAQGINVKHERYLYGRKRNEMMARARIHLNLHLYPPQIFEQVRVNFLLANQCFVISETTEAMPYGQIYNDLLVFANPEELAKQCKYYLEQPEKRQAIARRGLNGIRALRQDNYVAKALEQTRLKKVKSKPTIFVAIPSYVDRECVPTIKRLFEAAKHPECIHVGVCWQTNEVLGDFPLDDLGKWAGKVRVTSIEAKNSEGANWARMQALELSQDEDFTLLIDAHMHMNEGWDRLLLEQYQRAGGEKSVLTYYCPPYEPGGKFSPPNFCKRRVIVRAFGKKHDPQLLHLNRLIIDENDVRYDALYPTPFVVHHFIFARSAMFKDVALDPAIRFWGDEVTLSLRLWTYGYTVFQLPRFPAYHQWFEREQDAPLDYHDIENEAARENAEYVKKVLGIANKSTSEIEPQYRLGSVRKPQDFWRYAGIDMDKKQVLPAAESGMWNLEVLGAYGFEQSQLAAPVKHAKLNVQKTYGNNMVGLEKLTVCISAKEQEALNYTLQELFGKAAQPEQLQVVVAWHGAGQVAVPEELYDYLNSSLRIVHVAHPQLVANGFREALAAGDKREFIALMLAGTGVQNGWGEQLLRELSALEQGSFLTQIATEQPAYIAAGAAKKGLEELLISIASVEEKPDTLITPLISFDLLAGYTKNMLRCLPDPYLAGDALALCHAARLYTSGFTVLQANSHIVQTGMQDTIQQDERQTQRAAHLLGLSFSQNEAALMDIDYYGHGEVKDVEGFWSAAGVNVETQKIHPKALTGQWQALRDGKVRLSGKHMKPLHSVASSARFNGVEPRIFVQIASYRDEQCQYTVQDLFAKAANPERIFVGIVWQSIPEEDQECFRIVTRPEQVRVLHFDARESKGACWARHHGQKLWQGEEFTLQIDSHMRFEDGWDEMLLNMYHQLGYEKAVLTTYPAGFTPPDQKNPRAAHRLVAKEFSNEGIFTMQSRKIDTAKAHKPVPGAFMSACMLFGPSSIIEDVPYDPYLYFFGEEITLSARLWTHGYEIYHPNRHVVWHDWKRENRKTTHFKDHNWQTLNRRSFARVRFLLARQNPQKPEMREYVRKEMDKYGLGTVRSLREFETYAGISFSNRIINDRAKRGDFSFEPAPHEAKVRAPTIANQYDASDVPAANTNLAQPYLNVQKPTLMSKPTPKGPAIITGNKGPVKTLETPEIIVYDNFMPDEDFEKIYQHMTMSDYKHINTSGNVSRVWNIDNGFPLRSNWNRYYRVPGLEVPTENDYPQQKPTDKFIERINQYAPQVQHVIGAPGVHWAHYSVTSWLYPQNTGLSLHNDGSGAYSGAYVYYANKQWRIHWGGLLMVMDAAANQAMEDHKLEFNPHVFHKDKWLHETSHNDYIMEAGFARAVFPKCNRIVFIAPDAYHIVTKVLPAAGDNVRMTLAGFFNRGPLGKQQEQPKQHPLEVKQ